MDFCLRAPLESYADARLRSDARGRNGGVREKLEAGMMAKRFPAGTAYHEAGHAVVGYALGFRVRGIHINEHDEGGIVTPATAPYSVA